MKNLEKKKSPCFKKIKKLFLIEYYNFLNIFDKIEIDKFSFYKNCDYKLKFIKRIDANKLFRNRIYFIFNRKIKNIQKYLNEYLKKKLLY